MMKLQFHWMDEASAQAVVGWQYEPPYDIYNMASDDLKADMAYLLNPDYFFHAIYDEIGELAAFCSFGADAQVPGGDYSQEALDMGMGIRPNLTGQGNGRFFAQAVLQFAQVTFAPTLYRVTIAEFNKRAQNVWQGVGFQVVAKFESKEGKRPFLIFTHESQ
jgi:GNAT superfamily N-acetyltransferase